MIQEKFLVGIKAGVITGFVALLGMLIFLNLNPKYLVYLEFYISVISMVFVFKFYRDYKFKTDWIPRIGESFGLVFISNIIAVIIFSLGATLALILFPKLNDGQMFILAEVAKWIGASFFYSLLIAIILSR